MDDQFEGGSLCGAARFVATGQTKWVAWRHRQGTMTCARERLPTETHFHVVAFDEAARLQPTRHIFPEERLPWLHLENA